MWDMDLAHKLIVEEAHIPPQNLLHIQRKCSDSVMKMNRLTRLVNSINSYDFRRYHFTTSRTSIPPRRAITTLPLSLHRQFSPSLIVKFTSFATFNNPNFPTMESNPPESGEDFIHVENPNPDNVVALSESIVSLGESVVGYVDEVKDSTDAASEETKKELPEELSKSVVFLTCESSAEGGTCDVYVVGTAHISQVIIWLD